MSRAIRNGVPWLTPTLFAPMHGVGAKVVRDLVSSLGRPGLVCAPFLRITNHPPNIPWLVAQLERSADLPISVQLLGNHAQHLAQAAEALAEAGADVIDLNLGCPSRQVNRKSAGAALLGQLDEISRIVSGMRAACRSYLSVKMRAADESTDTTLEIAQRIEAAGADFLILHARTRAQGYTGVANWRLIRTVKAHLRIPVVGNGDCWYAADACRLLSASGADAVMLGRPALRNPFIFRQVEEILAGRSPYVPKGSDVFAHVVRLAERFAETLRHTRHGPEGALKEQLQSLLRSVPEPLQGQLRQRTLRAVRVADIVEAIRPLNDLGVIDIAADGPLRLEVTPNIPLQFTQEK